MPTYAVSAGTGFNPGVNISGDNNTLIFKSTTDTVSLVGDEVEVARFTGNSGGSEYLTFTNYSGGKPTISTSAGNIGIARGIDVTGDSTFTNISSPTVAATTSAGLVIKNNSGSNVALFGGAASTDTVLYGGISASGNSKITGDLEVTGVLTTDSISFEDAYALEVLATGTTESRTLGNRAADVISPLDFGAVGNGVANDFDAVQSAIDLANSTGKWFDGHGLIYAVSGSLVIPTTNTTKVKNSTFKQLSQSTSRRTIHMSGASADIHLERVSVNRNGTGSDGSIADAAGIWINTSGTASLNFVEVHGNGKGALINIIGGIRHSLTNCTVRDASWSNATDPGTEQIVGIWLQNTIDASILNTQAHRLGGYIGANPIRYYQTDGITCSGTTGTRIEGVSGSLVGEGIDITGTAGNSNFAISNVIFDSPDAIGIKCPVSASYGTITNCIIKSPGLDGFRFENASTAVGTHNIYVTNCIAINPGESSNWAGASYNGFRIDGTVFSPGPFGVELTNCHAIDTQSIPTMENGFLSRPIPTSATAITTASLAFGCTSTGHTTSAFDGVLLMTGTEVQARGANPYIRITDTDAGNNEKAWLTRASGTTLLYQVDTDAGGAAITYGSITRNGTTVTQVLYNPTSFQVGGVTSPTRVISANNSGVITLRYDDNSSTVPLIQQNYGITASGHGIDAITANFGTGGTNGARAGLIRVRATDTWATSANRDSEISIYGCLNGSSTEILTANPTYGVRVATGLISAVDDTAASAAGVPIGGLYQSSGAVRIRLV